MTLEDSLTVIEDTTSALLRLVGEGDEQACAPLLACRGEALAALASHLAAGDPSERERLAPRLAALNEADRALRQAAASALDRIAAEDRLRFGQDGRVQTAEREPRNACLDRRA